MKPIWLIAVNFLRQNRWSVVLIALWIIFLAGVFGLADRRPSHDDVVLYLRQLSAYAVAFSTFLAAAALQSERRSRRILSVLSKGITRAEYLAGLLWGTAVSSAGYCLCLGATASWLAGRARLPVEPVWAMMLMVFAVSLLAASIALFFSTFLHPLVATLAAATTLGGIYAGERLLLAATSIPLPLHGAMAWNLKYSLKSGTPWPLASAAVLLLEAGIFWAAAARAFARRDVTVAIE